MAAFVGLRGGEAIFFGQASRVPESSGGGFLTVKHNLGDSPLVVGKTFSVVLEYQATVLRQEIVGQRTGLNDAVHSDGPWTLSIEEGGLLSIHALGDFASRLRDGRKRTGPTPKIPDWMTCLWGGGSFPDVTQGVWWRNCNAITPWMKRMHLSPGVSRLGDQTWGKCMGKFWVFCP